MKKNSKKRVLLSSVAMLMVGAVSLGTATYAWFTNNKSVTADNMKVTAASATGLQITGKNGHAESWGPTYSFTGAATLSPVSTAYSNDEANAYTNFGTAWAPTEAGVEGPLVNGDTGNADKFTGWEDIDYPVAVTTSGEEAFNKNENFAVYEVGIRSSNATQSIKNVMMDVSYSNDTEGAQGKNACSYMRVAVLKQGADTTDVKNDDILAVLGDETSPNAVSNVTTGTDKKQTVTLANQMVEDSPKEGISIGEVTNTPQYYTILVWFEGQDTDCVDSEQQAIGEVDIKFYYN